MLKPTGAMLLRISLLSLRASIILLLLPCPLPSMTTLITPHKTVPTP